MSLNNSLKKLEILAGQLDKRGLVQEANVVDNILCQATLSSYLLEAKANLLKLVELCLYLEKIKLSQIAEKHLSTPFNDRDVYGRKKIEIIDYVQQLLKSEASRLNSEIQDNEYELMDKGDKALFFLNGQKLSHKIKESKVVLSYWLRLYEVFKGMFDAASEQGIFKNKRIIFDRLKRLVIEPKKGLSVANLTELDKKVVLDITNRASELVDKLEINLDQIVSDTNIYVSQELIRRLKSLLPEDFDTSDPIVQSVISVSSKVGYTKQKEMYRALLKEDLKNEYQEFQKIAGIKTVSFKLAVHHYKYLMNIVNLVVDWNRNIQLAVEDDDTRVKWLECIIDINDEKEFPDMTFQDYQNNIMFHSEKDVPMLLTHPVEGAIEHKAALVEQPFEEFSEKHTDIEQGDDEGDFVEEIESPEMLDEIKTITKPIEEKQFGSEQIRSIINDMGRFGAEHFYKLDKVKDILVYRYKSLFRTFLFKRDQFMQAQEKFDVEKEQLQNLMHDKLEESVQRTQWDSWMTKITESLDELSLQVSQFSNVEEDVNSIIKSQVYPVFKLMFQTMSN